MGFFDSLKAVAETVETIASVTGDMLEEDENGKTNKEAQNRAEEKIANLFSKYTDDEEVKAKIKQATHEAMEEADFDEEDSEADTEDEAED